MAPKSAKKPTPSKAQDASSEGKTPGSSSETQPSTTKESFEKELKDLAAKAQEETWSNIVKEQTALHFKPAIILILLGIYSSVSQLTLSPVYGSIPSGIHHNKLMSAACFVGWAMNRRIPRKADSLLPVMAAYIPVLQFYLFTASPLVGPIRGPVVTELVTLAPLAVVSAACVGNYVEEIYPGESISWPGIGSYAVYKLAEYLSGTLFASQYIGSSVVLTRLGLQAVLFLSYALVAPSTLILLAIPAVLHFGALNHHVPSSFALERANNSLLPFSYTLLDRKESLTGYLSVLENTESGFRVLRCDHSLLGGEWVNLKSLPQLASNVVAEPIYGVFAMLEAVRLVAVPDPVPDKEARALVIGMGVGTTPSALAAHGINTTVVEIDAGVVEFAHRYFSLPEDGAGLSTVVEDVVRFTKRSIVAGQAETYDYIVHDVFTGGAEPIELFTVEFLANLASLLKPNGVIAINYAGDFTHPTPNVITNTVKQVFPSCRIFREHARDWEALRRTGRDFTNMVLFCTKSDAEVEFREATEADMLNSPSREQFLVPKHEVRQRDFLATSEEVMVTRKSVVKLEPWQRKSAKGHWDVMRTVLPKEVWENW